jgi:hypothetical protein
VLASLVTDARPELLGSAVPPLSAVPAPGLRRGTVARTSAIAFRGRTLREVLARLTVTIASAVMSRPDITGRWIAVRH